MLSVNARSWASDHPGIISVVAAVSSLRTSSRIFPTVSDFPIGVRRRVTIIRA
jgi:hypothetical protein